MTERELDCHHLKSEQWAWHQRLEQEGQRCEITQQASE